MNALAVGMLKDSWKYEQRYTQSLTGFHWDILPEKDSIKNHNLVSFTISLLCLFRISQVDLSRVSGLPWSFILISNISQIYSSSLEEFPTQPKISRMYDGKSREIPSKTWNMRIAFKIYHISYAFLEDL